MGNPFFDPEAIKKSTIDIMELDGKQLLIKVANNEGLVTIAGFDGEKVYIIHTETECNQMKEELKTAYDYIGKLQKEYARLDEEAAKEYEELMEAKKKLSILEES